MMTKPLPHQAYAKGSKFRVTVSGVSLRGMKRLDAYSWEGWRQELQPGDVLTSGGYVRGWGSDPGPDIVTWTHVNGEPLRGVEYVEFSHGAGGFWETRPHPDYLIPE